MSSKIGRRKKMKEYLVTADALAAMTTQANHLSGLLICPRHCQPARDSQRCPVPATNLRQVLAHDEYPQTSLSILGDDQTLRCFGRALNTDRLINAVHPQQRDWLCHNKRKFL